MSVYRRIFRVTDGPLIDAIKEANEINAQAHKEYRAILEEIGASLKYYVRDGRMCGIIFDNEPDEKLFKSRGYNAGWWPKKNCKAGKELCARIGAVKTRDVQGTLDTVGLVGGCPALFRGGYAHYCTLVVIPESPLAAYVSVPWWDVDPTKMEDYKRRNAEGKEYDSSYHFVRWEPTPEMVEVKKWEFERHVDEWNSKAKEVPA